MYIYVTVRQTNKQTSGFTKTTKQPSLFLLQVLLSTGNFAKKDVMFGLNKDEGTYFVVYAVPGFNITGESLITRNEFLAGVTLAMDTASDVTRDAAIFHYTDWIEEDNRGKNRDSLCSLVGDQMFICPVLDFAHR